MHVPRKPPRCRFSLILCSRPCVDSGGSIFFLAVGLSLVLGLDSLINSKSRWNKLRSGAMQLESTIWKYRTRVGNFEIVGTRARAAHDSAHGPSCNTRLPRSQPTPLHHCGECYPPLSRLTRTCTETVPLVVCMWLHRRVCGCACARSRA